MTEPISVVVLSTGLENFKDIRRALSAEERVKLLAGGNDADQLYDEIVRLKPNAAIIAAGTFPSARRYPAATQPDPAAVAKTPSVSSPDQTALSPWRANHHRARPRRHADRLGRSGSAR